MSSRFAILALSLILASSSSACRRDDTRENPPVVNVADDDKEILDARSEAQRTLDEVVTALAKPPSPTTNITIKARMATGKASPTHEHIWVEGLRYEAGSFTGKLANEPVLLQGKKLGDTVTVPRVDVSDWMIIENDDVEHMKGGFTVKVLMAREKR
jgi:uncharacterized protein YegJ (DUF2314 family)